MRYMGRVPTKKLPVVFEICIQLYLLNLAVLPGTQTDPDGGSHFSAPRPCVSFFLYPQEITSLGAETCVSHFSIPGAGHHAGHTAGRKYCLSTLR